MLTPSVTREKTTSTIFKAQKEEKKRKYQQRILDVEMGSFTPLVFRTNGGMGADCICFLKRLAEKLLENITILLLLLQVIPVKVNYNYFTLYKAWSG